jgi:putative flippase GtrA
VLGAPPLEGSLALPAARFLVPPPEDAFALLAFAATVAVARAPTLASPQPPSAATPSRQSSATIAFPAVPWELTPHRLACVSALRGRYPERMREQATAVEIRPHMRLLHGMRRPANWLQLIRFGLVGGVGFVVNILVYTVLVHSAGADYRIASIAAWLVAVLNNFVLNRHWTFDARDGLARFQAIRFLLVSLVAEGFSLLLLTLLVEDAGMEKVAAQALAVAGSMPLNFLGNKLWSFRTAR